MSETPSEDLHREPEAMKAVLTALVGLHQEEQTRVLQWVSSKLKLSAGPAGNHSKPTAATASSLLFPNSGNLDKTLDPRAFMALKKPDNDSEKMACLAYYLTHYRDMPRFKTEHIVQLNSEAAQRGFGNPHASTKNAIDQSGYLVSAGEGFRQITVRGEAVVNALPDRDAVRKAQEAFPGGRKRKSSGPAKKE